MLFFIFSLLLCTGTLQNSVAFEVKDFVVDDIAPESLKYNPTLKHLIKASSLDSDLAVKETTVEKGIHKNETEDPFFAYEFPKELKDSREENITIDIPKSDLEKHPTLEVNKSAPDSPNLVYTKLKSILRKRMQLLLSNSLPENNDTSRLTTSDSSIESSKLTDTSSDDNTGESEKHSNDEVMNKETEEANVHANGDIVRARQLVFHPYLPYGKDVAPDEKISFHDVLPVKMVKFIKGMVEDAPWEKMFMQMVRMVVDQFVDKIIEKMFAHKEEEDDKWRSLDHGLMSPSWKLSKNVLTSVVRFRRSADGRPKPEKKHDWTDNSFTSANRVSKDDSAKPKDASPEDESWLDSILDYLFPEDPKADALNDAEDSDGRRKRDTNSPTANGDRKMSEIIRSFLLRYLEFQTGRLTPESVDAIVKESFRQKVLKTMFPSDVQMRERLIGDEELTSDVGSDFSEHKLPEILSERWLNVLNKDPQPVIENSSYASKRAKRSTTDDTDKEKDAQRLWQANRRTRPSNSKTRDDCSLRRACNAGRLLSRLPSVQDITLQLKGYGNEPHWDALLWGMTKKRCSRIFCKRQRAPKGSKRHWDAPEKRNHRKSSTPTSRAPRLRYEESDLTTIYPV